ncbi:hypothetical protein [Qipengyuania sp. JC766]|uniref:hypothetical protein n=1 Tax=Qipengyuania sp. JC766 TaxID=3232139 RepID=UPI003458DCD0
MRAIIEQDEDRAEEAREADMAAGEGLPDGAPWTEEWVEEDVASRSGMGRIVPAIAILAVVGWTALVGFAHRAEIMAGTSLTRAVELVVQWTIPVVLVAALYLILQRNSRSEAARFARTARALSAESAELETRLATVNRELSLAREFLGSQSRELETLGRVATQRIGEQSDRLESLIGSNAAQMDAIDSASESAVVNMNRLRADLPVIANSARDVANQIGVAGNTAQDSLGALQRGFETLSERGAQGEERIRALQSHIEDAMEAFDAKTRAVEQFVQDRLSQLRDAADAWRSELETSEAQAAASMRRRIDGLRNEIADARTILSGSEDEAVEALVQRAADLRAGAEEAASAIRSGEEEAASLWNAQVDSITDRLTAAIAEIQRIDQQALESANAKLEALREEAEQVDRNILYRDQKLMDRVKDRQAMMLADEGKAIASFEVRLAAIDKAFSERRGSHEEFAKSVEELDARLAEPVRKLRETVATLASDSERIGSNLEESATLAERKLADSRNEIAQTDAAIAQLTDASVRLLELIQASSQHSQDHLPQAIRDAHQTLSDLADRVDALYETVTASAAKGEDLSSYVIAARDESRQATADIEIFNDRVAQLRRDHVGLASDIRTDLDDSTAAIAELSEKTRTELATLLERLRDAAEAAPGELEAALMDRADSLGEEVGKRAVTSLEEALNTRIAAAIEELEQNSDRIGAAGRQTIMELRDQLGRINELAINLENRVAQARERAEERIDNDFARRSALITEALNSNAIDIAKALDADVSDSSWASYLRGDRGIFTRRAVRLLNNSEARELAELYDADPDFRENVSRYIHDFEAMLRTMLSTRDGNALSVTLLSSDMGKLYVALAQAIERLRD